ncbi:hypothetical protein K443DRAFT_363781 [Laccaria amethystina LaAM-08-1]|jgi:hypothetical protein|uniref:Uncharacterized protein n=1 Tax=Laccaria amethystina LaAM-08-1 TaxID=1095629 RepID=A0A0C9WZC8_9AGAR|nr:hypothetical protein K443DRAFT_363781 [Laccaria amethystina LaAM-08-1]
MFLGSKLSRLNFKREDAVQNMNRLGKVGELITSPSKERTRVGEKRPRHRGRYRKAERIRDKAQGGQSERERIGKRDGKRDKQRGRKRKPEEKGSGLDESENAQNPEVRTLKHRTPWTHSTIL